MAISETSSYEEKKEWVFAPFMWALFSSFAAVPAFVYWYIGEDKPTVTIISLAAVIILQFSCVVWGILRLRRAIN